MPSWTIYLDGGPRRVNHAAVELGGQIFSFGGYCSGELTTDQKSFIDVHFLNTFTYRWTRIPFNNSEAKSEMSGSLSHETHIDVPFQRYGHTAVEWQGKAYIWGGRNDDYGANNVLHEFDPITRVWRSIKTFGFVPPSRDGHTAVVYDDRMIVFGGFEEELQRFSQETYVYNFKTNTWREMPTNNPPMWRDFHTAAIIEDTMYIYGGRSDQSGQVGDEHLFHSTNDFYDASLMALNLKDGNWKKVEVNGIAPTGRRSHSAWVHNNRMYMFGGYLGTKNIHYNEVYCFDPTTSQWSIVEVSGNYPSPRRRHCTVVVGSRVFLFGGTMPNPGKCSGTRTTANPTTTGLSDLADLHVLDFEPSLKTLAMSKILENDVVPSYRFILPCDVRREMFFMTCHNTLSNNVYPRSQNAG